LITTEEWTGNAEMIIEKKHPQSRSYRCSPGFGEKPFDPKFEFEIEWEPFDK